MDEDTMQTNLNTLKEIILDEQKLVTYTSISKDLCLHVNDSKRLLSKVIEDIKKTKPEVQLNICFILSGIVEENKARTTVSLERDVENLRKEFKSIFYEHVYSAGLGRPEADPVAFVATNKFQDFTLCTGLIKSASCVKRTSDEIGHLKSHSQDIVPVEQIQINQVKKKIKEESKDAVKNGHIDVKTVAELKETKSEPIIKKEIPSPTKNQMNTTSQKHDNKKNGSKTQKGIAGFFSKSNSAPTKRTMKETMDPKITEKVEEKKTETVVEKKTEKVVEKKTEKVVEKKTEKVEVKAIKTEKLELKGNPKTTEVPMDVDDDVKPKKEEEKTIVKNEKSKSKTVSQTKKNAKVDKKRKRVLQVSDSESDEDKDPFAEEPARINEESDDDIPPTPNIPTVKITSGIVNPKKKRKVVDKTYTDEEGYILTKKEVVYESCSDNDDEQTKVTVKKDSEMSKENVKVPPNNPIKMETSPIKSKAKNTKKKISPPQKGKQATLMNFFKKV